ncbi:MAG: cytochrome P450 [Actinomycetota bacterium]|nr:cytochrome P450 [Actinomycetota bacterium]
MTTTFDFQATDFVADPYPHLSELRCQGPVLWHEPSGTWLATTHDAVSQTLRNRAFGRIWTDWQPTDEMEPFNALHRNQMMENEPPDHSRLRRLVSKAFARGHVERMRPRVEQLAASLLDQLSLDRLSLDRLSLDRLDGTIDILGAYAEPLPVLVIADLLGVPGEDHVMLRDWSQAIVHMYEQGVGEETRKAAVKASTAFGDYVRQVVAERTKAPREDLISDLISARDAEGRLSEDELVASVVLLLNAGHEASVNVFGNGIHALLTHPDQLERVVSGDVPMAVALEELIRFDAPLQLFERTATADVDILGETVREGQKIAALMGSANRDATVFDDADDFDVARDPNPHVGFGMGLHFCLGAPLARMELEITLNRLIERFPGLQLAGESPRRPTWVLRGFERIDVSLEDS